MAGESFQDPSSYPWTKDDFKLPETRRELEKLSQEIQKSTPPLTNLLLSNSKIEKFFGGVVLTGPLTNHL